MTYLQHNIFLEKKHLFNFNSESKGYALNYGITGSGDARGTRRFAGRWWGRAGPAILTPAFPVLGQRTREHAHVCRCCVRPANNRVEKHGCKCMALIMIIPSLLIQPSTPWPAHGTTPPFLITASLACSGNRLSNLGYRGGQLVILWGRFNTSMCILMQCKTSLV